MAKKKKVEYRKEVSSFDIQCFLQILQNQVHIFELLGVSEMTFLNKETNILKDEAELLIKEIVENK